MVEHFLKLGFKKRKYFQGKVTEKAPHVKVTDCVIELIQQIREAKSAWSNKMSL